MAIKKKMVIYAAQIVSLMKYTSAKWKQQIVKSDHNVVFASFDIQFQT